MYAGCAPALLLGGLSLLLGLSSPYCEQLGRNFFARSIHDGKTNAGLGMVLIVGATCVEPFIFDEIGPVGNFVDDVLMTARFLPVTIIERAHLIPTAK